MNKEEIRAIARWLWPTMPVNGAKKPAPESVTWETWHGQHVKVVAGPFRGRHGMAAGIGWGRVEVVFPNFHRVWFDGPLLCRVTKPSGM